MDIAAKLKTYLTTQNTTAGGRIYPKILPQNVTYPALTFEQVSAPRSTTHDGADGLVSARWQITAWATTHLAMTELRAAVGEALHAGTMSEGAISNIRREDGPDLYDSDVGPAGKLGVHYGPSDFIIQYTE